MINESKRKELDSHWEEIGKLAEKYGFIVGAYGGMMVLATHENQIKDFGEEKYLHRQKEMFRNDMTEENENDK